MSSKNSYRLINPYIEGSIDTIVKSRDSLGAGKKIYGVISNYFTNHVKDFYMTVQNLETKDLTHFLVNEQRGKGNDVDYKINKFDSNLPKDLENKLVTNVEKMDSQSGGKYHKHQNSSSSSSSNSSSSSSDSNDYQLPIQPITRFTYFYLPYYTINTIGISAYDASRIYIPMFSLPINPTLEVRFDVYKY